jgi:YD repeat-containing protein
VKQPDNGLTTFTYDPAGNLTEKITANIRKNIPNGGAIKYTYDFERVMQIDYPKNIQNKVQYSYGVPGEGNGRAGRLTLVQDGSGGQEFFYSPLGQVTKTIRTLMIGDADIRTYIAESAYDTWNRITSMTYPDGETITYTYDAAGNLQTLKGIKDGRNYAYAGVHAIWQRHRNHMELRKGAQSARWVDSHIIRLFTHG